MYSVHNKRTIERDPNRPMYPRQNHIEYLPQFRKPEIKGKVTMATALRRTSEPYGQLRPRRHTNAPSPDNRMRDPDQPPHFCVGSCTRAGRKSQAGWIRATRLWLQYFTWADSLLAPVRYRSFRYMHTELLPCQL